MVWGTIGKAICKGLWNRVWLGGNPGGKNKGGEERRMEDWHPGSRMKAFVHKLMVVFVYPFSPTINKMYRKQ